MSFSALLAKANGLFVDEEYDDALELYNEAALLPEATPEVYAKRSMCHAKLENWEDVLNDCDKYLEKVPDDTKVLLRKGNALYTLKRFEEAKGTFSSGAKLDAKTFGLWVKKCEAEIKLTESGGKSVAVTTSSAEPKKTSSSGEVAQKPTHSSVFKHEWYQNADYVIVSILAKGFSQEQIVHEFTEDMASVTINIDSDQHWALDLVLCENILPQESTITVTKSKIELKLKKNQPCRWEALEKSDTKSSVTSRPWADTSKVNKHTYPTSSKKPKNWDELDREAAKIDEEEKPSGDAALNKLFQDIYSKADEETRRAMNKSFVESGGTVLSTNWKEVGSKKVEGAPPKGMEKKYYEK
eukprot:c18825_g1_i1.p1 GENE.c18825_g1_i1~~c18825_g1_i1.p1  ORF type:complete len:355 (+),score=153.51 c18825_g1_i1:16-1080(+)